MDNKVKGINLLPNEYIVAQRINFYEKIISAVAIVEVACFVGFVALPPKQELERTQIELEEKKSQLTSPRYAGVNKTLSDLEATKQAIQTWVTTCNGLDNGEFINSKLLDALTARVPVGVTISAMNLDNIVAEDGSGTTHTVTIKGTLNRIEDGMNYLSVIETLFPTNSIAPTITGSTFTIVIKVPELEQPAEAASETAQAAGEEPQATGEEATTAGEDATTAGEGNN